MRNRRTGWLDWACLALSTTLFIGFLPGIITRRRGLAGGTMGALAALWLQFALPRTSVTPAVVAVLATFVIGWLVVGPAERLMLRLWGSRRRHTGEVVETDFNETNVDEVHGQLLAGLPLWLWSVDGTARTVLLIASFVLFRLFDVLKPWPVSWVERRFKGTAFGVMIDDTVAGLLAAVVITLLIP